MRVAGRRSRLLEREEELDRAREVVEAAGRGAGSVVAFVGPPGIGKTSLLEALTERARRRELVTLSARGSEFERDFAFALVRQLLEPHLASLGDGERSEAFAGAASLATDVLDAHRASGAGPQGTLQTSLHGLYWLVANLADREPLLIAIDDLHWADHESVGWLGYLCRRLEGLPVLVAVAARESEPGTDWSRLEAELREASATVVRPKPLGEDAISQLIRERLGEAPTEEFTRACQGASGGNPFLVRELVRELASSGVRPVTSAAGEVSQLAPEAVARTALTRLARLGPDCVRLAKALAVLGDGADQEIAAELAELEPTDAARAADALASAHVIAEELPLRFIHPLVGAAIHDDIPPLERGTQHARAGRLCADRGEASERTAGHLLRSPPTGEPWAVEVLEEAAAGALSRRAADRAAAYLRRALGERPEGERRANVLRALGVALVLGGDPQGAGYVREALPLIAEREARIAAAARLTQSLGNQGYHAEALEVLALIRSDADDPGVELAVELGEALIGWYRRETHAEAVRRGHQLLGAPEVVELTLGRRVVATAAWRLAAEPRPVAEALRLAAIAAPAEIQADPDEVDAAMDSAWALAVCDELEEAERIAALAFARAQQDSLVAVLGEVSMHRAYLASRRGDVRTMIAEGRVAVEAIAYGFGVMAPACHAGLAVGLIEEGALAAAQGALELHDEERFTDHLSYPALLEARGRWHLDAADPERALRAYEAAAEGWQGFGMGLPQPSFTSWRVGAAVACAQLGDRERAAELAEEELRLARILGIPSRVGIALRAVGVVTEGEPGASLLEEAIFTLAPSPARLEHARALVELGALLRREGRRRDAREPLNDGMAMARGCGATALATRAYEELRAAGARPRKIVRSGVEALTPSERRVAQMAAQGMSNKEIAQALFVTVRTVEAHLRHAYQKLGVSSRRELGPVLAG